LEDRLGAGLYHDLHQQVEEGDGDARLFDRLATQEDEVSWADNLAAAVN
jgi:hypothetical protein